MILTTFLEGFLSCWARVLEKMPQNWETIGEAAGFVSIVAVTMVAIIFGFGGLMCLIGTAGRARNHKTESKIDAEVRQMRGSSL